MINEQYLKPEERAVFALRSLYRTYGYLPYKMSKFEEYDLYLQNKDFLISDRIITFNDVGGKLLALKPDVTLSIIKNGEDAPGCKQKVSYDENVYRVSGTTGHFKEILQTGVECIGDIDAYDICEVVTLAAASLDAISPRFVLDVSHLGVLSALMDDISHSKAFREEVTRCLGEKNAHDLARVCATYGVDAEDTATLCDFVTLHGSMDEVLQKLAALCHRHKAITVVRDELTMLRDRLAATPYADRIRFDFSIINDMNYYNGIVFCGFLDGICEGVLSGGQYHKLMRRMGRKSGAIGFALYLDLLEALETASAASDVDVLLLYDATVTPSAVAARVDELREAGKTVSAQRAIPAKLRFGEIIDMRKEIAL